MATELQTLQNQLAELKKQEEKLKNNPIDSGALSRAFLIAFIYCTTEPILRREHFLEPTLSDIPIPIFMLLATCYLYNERNKARQDYLHERGQVKGGILKLAEELSSSLDEETRRDIQSIRTNSLLTEEKSLNAIRPYDFSALTNLILWRTPEPSVTPSPSEDQDHTR
jgi:hypothetical protein